MDRSVKADMEGGERNMSSLQDFILNSKCAKIVWRPGCARTHKGLLSVPHRLAKPQWATREGTMLHTPSRSYGRVAVGEGGGRRTDRNMKEELEGGVGKFYFKQLLPDIFMSKFTKNIWRPGSARIPLGSLSAPRYTFKFL